MRSAWAQEGLRGFGVVEVARTLTGLTGHRVARSLFQGVYNLYLVCTG